MAFKPGVSGNPKGRPPGSGLRQLLTPHAPALVNKAVSLALDEGNETALRICIDRILPALKPESPAIAMEGISGSLSEQGAGVLRALVAGEITPDHQAHRRSPFIGGLIIYPGGIIECIVCGRVGSILIGVISVALGVAGFARGLGSSDPMPGRQ